MESFGTFEEAADHQTESDPDKPRSNTFFGALGLAPKNDDDEAGVLSARNVIDPSDGNDKPQNASRSEFEPDQTYPSLSNTSPESPKAAARIKDDEDEDDQLDLSKSFARGSSPLPTAYHLDRNAVVSKVGDQGAARMHKFTLYETTNYYYVVGADILDSAFRILKIHRNTEVGELVVSEDEIVYSRNETFGILSTIDEGNKSTGGLKLTTTFWGLLGFIRFTGPYYMVCVTKRSQVAVIGGHYVYQIDKTELMALQTAAQSKIKSDTHLEESRFLQIFSNLDLSRSFYFSYSYDATRTLQHNIKREREALQQGLAEPSQADHNDMFVWNHHLLAPAKTILKKPFDWCLAIIHGYVDQAGLSVYWGRTVYVTIIARRSRFFAGARYLKRGANDLGHVANDVETEQIVSEMLTTSFHKPGPTLFANPQYTSHVQHRGSIPLHWAQDSTGVNPKPDINLSVVDPFFSAAALHFDDLFKRYGTPIYVLNLVKSRERTPRESKLLKEFTLAVSYLNQFLPEDKKILYRAWDMSRASKSRDQDVIGGLEGIAVDILPKTGFFQNGDDAESGLKLQNGVARTNCIDCLDRTNAAQFVIAKQALGYQLQALGIIEEPSVPYDSDAVNLFTHMWHDHGDTIAIQYGGSHLVNTMATYRKINQWTSHSRDMVESFKRYYNNSFMDAQRQEAYNLFLGNYVFVQGQPMLWDLSTDYYLHHSDPKSMFGRRRPNYRHWFTDEYLKTLTMPASLWPHELSDQPLKYFDDYWIEYYRPLALTSFRKLFAFKMHSNLRYIPMSHAQSGKYDLSPFKVRSGIEAADAHGNAKANRRKGVKIIAPSDESIKSGENSVVDVKRVDASEKKASLQSLGPWLDAQHRSFAHRYTGIIKETSFQAAPSRPSVPQLPPTAGLSTVAPSTKAELATQAFTAMVAKSLAPTVSETDEYQRYIDHPSNIPLVVSQDIDYASAEAKVPTEFLDYVSRTADPAALEVSRHNAPSLFTAYSDLRDQTRGVLGLSLDERAEVSLEVYTEFVESGGREEPLTVSEEDSVKKRYKAYRQWLRGKSLFKQRPMVGGEGA